MLSCYTSVKLNVSEINCYSVTLTLLTKKVSKSENKSSNNTNKTNSSIDTN